MTTRDEGIVRTSGKRMAQGIAIIVGVMAVGAAIAIPNWHNFASHPPPVSMIATVAPARAPPIAAAGGGGAGPALSILQGASTQGNPAYDPATLTVKKGDSIQVTNKDSVPHTVTNGKDASDPTSGKLFDTSIINAGSTAKVSTAKLNTGDYPYHCTVHPYMTGLLKVK